MRSYARAWRRLYDVSLILVWNSKYLSEFCPAGRSWTERRAEVIADYPPAFQLFTVNGYLLIVFGWKENFEPAQGNSQGAALFGSVSKQFVFDALGRWRIVSVYYVCLVAVRRDSHGGFKRFTKLVWQDRCGTNLCCFWVSTGCAWTSKDLCVQRSMIFRNSGKSETLQ